MMAGRESYQNAMQAQQQQQLFALKMAEVQRQAAAVERARAERTQLLSMLGGQPQPVGVSDGTAASMGAPWAAASNLPQAPQRGVPGVDPLAIRLMLSEDAGLSKVGSAIQEAGKPTDRQRDALALGLRPGSPEFNSYVGTQFTQGGAWQVDPATGQVRLAPGYAAGAGAIREAEERAKAGLDFIDVAVPGGGTQKMSRAEYARLRGGQAPVAAPQPVPVSVSPTRTRLDPGGLGYQRPEAERQAEQKFGEAQAAEMSKQYSDLLRADFNAPNTIARYKQLGSLLSQSGPGKFKATTTGIKAAAKGLGMDLAAAGVTDDVAPAQAAIALSNHLALELRNPAGGAGMPGAMSDKDREFLMQSVPGLENDPGAIGLMVDYRVRLAQREQDVARMARAYKKRTGQFDDGFYSELALWSGRNPLFPVAERNALPPIPKTPANRGGIQFLGFESK
jgi:hypothetical protein